MTANNNAKHYPHWIDELTDEIIENWPKIKNFNCNCGISVSGLQHVGRLRGEIVLTNAVTQELIKKGYLVIVVIDRNFLKKTRDEFKGHYTLLIGFDENGFILNEPFLEKNLPLDFDTFEKAFNSPDDIKDVIIAYGKK